MKKPISLPDTMASIRRFTADELDHLRAPTYPGQVHWGCSQRTCRECVYWNLNERIPA